MKSSDGKKECLQLPMVSVIIPAHNEEKTIKRKVENTYSLNYPKDRFEVIVVDDGSTDRTLAILKKIGESRFPGLRIITQSWKGKSAAVNKGLQNSRSEVIVISDADIALNPNSLRFMIEDFDDPTVGGVTCKTMASEENVLALNFRLGLRARQLESMIDSSFGMAGSFVSFRKSIVPLIDEGVYADDVDIAVVIRKRGYRVVYDQRIVGFVDRWVEGKPRSVISALKKLKHMSFGNIQLLFRHKDILFRSRYGVFGWVIAPRRILFDVFAPFVFVLLSINFIAKAINSNLLLPFSLFASFFLLISFVSRKVAPTSTVCKVLYLTFMYVVRYYAVFFYYAVFILQRKERRGLWEKFRN